MATFLDISLLQHFKIVFPILFVFAIVYALLTHTKFLGDNRTIHAIIALMLAIMVAFSDIAVATISNMAPWFVLLFILIIFGLMAYKSFGFSDTQIMSALTARPQRWLITGAGFIALSIFLGSLMGEVSERGGVGVYGIENATETPSGEAPEQTEAFYETLFHPKVLGITFILVLAIAAIAKLVVPEVH